MSDPTDKVAPQKIAPQNAIPQNATPENATPEPENDLVKLAALAGEWVEATEAAAVGIFEAEVAALNAALAAEPGVEETQAEREARERAEAEAIERDLDNLPV